jgi:hypothetical protein
LPIDKCTSVVTSKSCSRSTIEGNDAKNENASDRSEAFSHFEAAKIALFLTIPKKIFGRGKVGFSDSEKEPLKTAITRKYCGFEKHGYILPHKITQNPRIFVRVILF